MALRGVGSTWACFCVMLLVAASPSISSAQHSSNPLVEHVSQQDLILANVGLTSALTLSKRLIEGEINEPRDVIEAVAAGAVSGYGFYQAKKLMGTQHYTSGMALAFGAASLAENVATGDHPLGYVRLGPGPIDLRIRTPLARSEGATLTMEVNPVAFVAAGLMPFMGYTAEMNGGTLQYRSSQDLGYEGHHSRVGLSLGRLIVLAPTATETVRAHELIHYVQTIQLQAVSPYPTLGRFTSRAPLHTSRHLAWDVQLKHTLAAAALLSAQFSYERRWTEREAYSLQGEEPEPLCPPDGICSLGKTIN